MEVSIERLRALELAARRAKTFAECERLRREANKVAAALTAIEGRFTLDLDNAPTAQQILDRQ